MKKRQNNHRYIKQEHSDQTDHKKLKDGQTFKVKITRTKIRKGHEEQTLHEINTNH